MTTVDVLIAGVVCLYLAMGLVIATWCRFSVEVESDAFNDSDWFGG